VNKNEILHYIFVYAVLLGLWPEAMKWFRNDIYLTAGAVFVGFIVADKIAHKYIMHEK
jgi:hypothetical protein